jgi:hypothetical protein
MGYSISRMAVQTYIQSNDVLIANDAPVSTNALTFVTLKTIVLNSDIGLGSKFRFSYDLKTSNALDDANSGIYLNGVYLDGINANDLAYTNHVFNPTYDQYKAGDIIDLMLHSSGGSTASAQNFRISGLGSIFLNTLE